MKAHDLFFELSENNEQIVRSYQCTELRPFLSNPTIGYLTITNKRIIFHSEGKTKSSKSFLINEMPIEDVAGVNVYEGTSINWIGIFISAFLGYAISSAILGVLSSTFVLYLLAFLMIIPHSFLLLLRSNILDESIREQIYSTLQQTINWSLKENIETVMRYTGFPFKLSLLFLFWGINGILERSDIPLFSSTLMFAFYFYVCFKLFGQNHVFTLMIGSKTMRDSGISVRGNIFQATSTRGNTALYTPAANPSVDAAIVTKEIGALLLDIRQLGDLGIKKWQTR